MSDDFVEILHARRDAKILQIEGDSWNFDEEPLATYENFFEPLIHPQTIQGMVDSMRQGDLDIRATNILGGLRVLRDLNVSEGTAVRLTDKRTVEEKQQDGQQFQVVPGFITSPKLWEQLPDDQHIILSVGKGAVFHLPDSIPVMYTLVNNAYKKLAEPGIMLLQGPADMGKDLTEWASSIPHYTQSNIAVGAIPRHPQQNEFCALYVVRLPGSPAELPMV